GARREEAMHARSRDLSRIGRGLAAVPGSLGALALPQGALGVACGPHDGSGTPGPRGTNRRPRPGAAGPAGAHGDDALSRRTACDLRAHETRRGALRPAAASRSLVPLWTGSLRCL